MASAPRPPDPAPAGRPRPQSTHFRMGPRRLAAALRRLLSRRTPLGSASSPAPVISPGVGLLPVRPAWAMLARLRWWRQNQPMPLARRLGSSPAPGQLLRGEPDRPPAPGQLLRAGRARGRPLRPPASAGHRPVGRYVSSAAAPPDVVPGLLVARSDLDLPIAPVWRMPAGPAGSGSGVTGPAGTSSASSRSRSDFPAARPVVPVAAAGHRAGSVASIRPVARIGGTALPLASSGHPDVRAGQRAATAPAAAHARPRSLAARPPAGPAVLADRSARDLPVLGSSPAASGAVGDPTLAVRFTVPAQVIRRSGPVLDRMHPSGVRSDATAPAGTPRQRWEAAVAAQPLETPRPLPAPLHALARAITGRQHPPRFTTGPATRRALAAAGALGATTGSVVHLPAVPTSAPTATTVLAHELAHTRNPVRRPRFLLGNALGLADDDERQAVAAGRQMLGQGGPSGAAGPVAAGIVERLPVGGGLAGIQEAAAQAVQAKLAEATPPPATLARLLGALDELPGAAPTTGFDASGDLPGLPTVPAAAGAPGLPALPVGDGYGPAGGSAGVAGIGGAAAPAGGGGPGGSATTGPGVPLDADRVVAMVEERLLREIERRGGRWAGVF
jgi:hypothetical protein